MKIILFSILVLFSASSFASDVNFKIEMKDQHEKAQVIPENTQVLLFASEMEGYKMARDAFEKLKISDLNAINLSFVADISKMPALISKMFAMPKMRKLPYSILLDKDGTLTKAWPRQEKQLAWLKVADNQVVETQWFSKTEELEEALRTLKN